MDLWHWLSFATASALILIVPGPTVTVIIANSLRLGTSFGFANILGTQIGLCLMVILLALGLDAVMMLFESYFGWIKLFGSAYLIWLGTKLWRARGEIPGRATNNNQQHSQRHHKRYYVWQGLLVIWANPKALLFFGAFLPQFIDPGGQVFWQTLLLGMTFMLLATLLDGLYAISAGTALKQLSRQHIRRVEKLSGSALMGGGLWLLAQEK